MKPLSTHAAVTRITGEFLECFEEWGAWVEALSSVLIHMCVWITLRIVCSFGRLLEAWAARRAQESPGISSSFAASMFSRIYSRPLCSVFASSSELGFAGPCEALPATCENETVWCSGDDGRNDGPVVVQGNAPPLHRTHPSERCTA